MLAVLLFWGCTRNVDDWESFVREHATAQCLVYKQCHRSLFDGEYETMGNCEEEVMEYWVDFQDEFYSGCTFLVDQAQKCLSRTYAATCAEHWDDQESIYQSCHDELWTCSVE
ncbi:MAG: hypothetical protein VX278_23730 [Myxococcota bacterium]|nr:hypothetical protein [Myxococcota bacterium]